MVIENLKVYGLENAIRGSKFPMSTNINDLNSDITNTVKSLASSGKGEGHDQFLTGIITQFDLTFTIKAWTEAERYHFLDFISSQSTMHRIAKFDIEKQMCSYVTQNTINEVNRLKDIYNEEPTAENYLTLLYNVPVGFKLTASMTTNYRQLKTIVSQRSTHRLPEWREFCKQVEEFPMFKELIYKDEKKGDKENE